MQCVSNHKAECVHSINILNTCSWLWKMPCASILKIPQRNCTIHEMGLNNHNFSWVKYVHFRKEWRSKKRLIWGILDTRYSPTSLRWKKDCYSVWRQQKQTNWKTSMSTNVWERFTGKGCEESVQGEICTSRLMWKTVSDMVHCHYPDGLDKFLFQRPYWY